MPDDSWLSVWSALSEESLENRLRHYLWLSRSAPALYQQRYEHLVAEAERREKLELVERARRWVASHNAPTPLK